MIPVTAGSIVIRNAPVGGTACVPPGGTGGAFENGWACPNAQSADMYSNAISETYLTMYVNITTFPDGTIVRHGQMRRQAVNASDGIEALYDRCWKITNRLDFGDRLNTVHLSPSGYTYTPPDGSFSCPRRPRYRI